MKITGPSADLLIKLALIAVGVGVAVYAVRKVTGLAASSAKYINPLSTENVAYQTVNSVGAALVGNPSGPGMNADGSWSLGGWIYDVTH